MKRKSKTLEYLFAVWGFLGFLVNLINGENLLFTTSSIGVGASSYYGALATIWIGGMVFFGLGSLMTTGEGGGIFISTAEA